MRVGIMQPYLFPYIGYFQLIKCVDKYVIYDDVNFIKQGWINRNRILVNKKEHIFTLEVIGASSFKPINTTEVGNNRNTLIKTIEQSYSKAPFFGDAFDIVRSVISYDDHNLGRYLTHGIVSVCNYLDIKTNLLISSQIPKDTSLYGQDKVLHLCKLLDANEYVNAIGGQSLYSKESFDQAGVSLHFLKSEAIAYRQFSNPFVANLSIIDVMMFNSPDEIQGMLAHYELC